MVIHSFRVALSFCGLLAGLTLGAPFLAAQEPSPNVPAPDRPIPFVSPGNPSHGYCEPDPSAFRPIPASANAPPQAEADSNKTLSVMDMLVFPMERAFGNKPPARARRQTPPPYAPNWTPAPEPVPGKRFLLDRNGRNLECELYNFKHMYKVYDLEGRLLGVAMTASFTIYEFPGVLPEPVSTNSTPALPRPHPKRPTSSGN